MNAERARESAPASPPPPDLEAVLEAAAGLAGELGPVFEGHGERLREYLSRLRSERLHVAVLGQFKRGKSTLLNALLGEEILPVSVVPLTSVPTFLLAGKERRAEVSFANGKPPAVHRAETAQELVRFLERYVTEARNRGNRRQVSRVEVRHPSRILESGVVLIDTPGIGSTYRHNTETTVDFLPQCDAALFVVSADPPITEVETEFLERVRPFVARIHFVLNKADYLRLEEREEATAFLAGVLREILKVEDPDIWCVSAREGLRAGREADEAALRESGISEIEERLLGGLVAEKRRILAGALRRKADAELADFLSRVKLTSRALSLPVEELTEKMALFSARIREARDQQRAAADRIAGDRRRALAHLEEQAARLRERMRSHLLETAAGAAGEEEARKAVSRAVPPFFRAELARMSESFREYVGGVLAPHQRRADELIRSVREAAAEIFEVPYEAPESRDAFRMVREPYWVEQDYETSLSPLPDTLVDRLLPRGAREARVRKRLGERIDRLVTLNVENLRWAAWQSVQSSFDRFRDELSRRLEETIRATEGAIRVARRRREEQAGTVEEELSRLAAAERTLAALRSP